MRFSKLIVSLPVLLCAAQLSQPFSFAQAAAMGAEQATELLAKSHAINVKCSVLSADQSQELKDFVARAEISLAEKASVSAARKAIANGRVRGKAAMCDEAAKKLVNDVLAAAEAATVAPVEDQTIAAAAPEPVTSAPSITQAEVAKPEEKAEALVQPAPAPKSIETTKLVKPKQPAASVKLVKVSKSEKAIKVVKPAKNLQGYASVVEKYYVATRCGNMSRKAINALYQQVLINHKQAVAGNRAGDVRATLQVAEARAGSKSCT